MKYKYSNELLAEAVKASFSIIGVLGYIGATKTCGSVHKRIKTRIEKLGLDTSHFKRPTDISAEVTRLTVEEILVLDRRKGIREPARNLRRAMREMGISYKCSKCANEDIWQGLPLLLEVDHIDENPVNNCLSNLRFVCPNCHSQIHNKRGSG